MLDAHRDLLPWTAQSLSAGLGHGSTSTKDAK